MKHLTLSVTIIQVPRGTQKEFYKEKIDKQVFLSIHSSPSVFNGHALHNDYRGTGASRMKFARHKRSSLFV